MANLKMTGAGLVDCPEIEQLRGCIFFKGEKSDPCPDCYALPLLKLRLKTAAPRAENRPGHGHPSTARRGLIRLGTYREILPADWRAFKRGEGTWDCCGAPWERHDFRTRNYFLITRGLNPDGFYEEVAADPLCVNIQVSVDLWPDGRLIPDENRLRQFALNPKVIFRAKTTPQNAKLWGPLFDRLQVVVGRVMETPLRSRVMETKLIEGAFAYGRETLLQQAGWKWQTFLRCNTACADCVKENGVTACAARPPTLLTLATRRRPDPPRHTYRLHHLKWADEARRCIAEHGGRVTVQEAYAWFTRRHPELAVAKPNWQFKVRVALQRAGVMAEEGGWRATAPNLESYG